MRKLLFTSLIAMNLAFAMADTKGVVMDYGALDTIDALGANQSVAAVPKGNAPEYLKQYTADTYISTGGLKDANLELISDIKPDFIIVSGRIGKSIEDLEKIAPVINFAKGANEDYLGSAEENIILVGKAVNKESEAKKAWDELKVKIDAAAHKINQSDKKALVVLHNDGKLISMNTSGHAELVHNVLKAKRADANTEKTEGRTIVDESYLTEKNPDIIFIIDRSAAIGATPLDLKEFNDQKYANIQAVKDNKVIYLTPALWYLSGRGLESLELQAAEILNTFQ